MNIKKLILIAVLVLLLVASVIAAVFADKLAGVSASTAYTTLFGAGNARLTKAVIGLVAFVILGLFGVVYKGPKR